MHLGTFQVQATVYHIGCFSFQGYYKSVNYDNIWYTSNDLNYSIGVKLECNSNDTGMMSYLLIYEKIDNNPLLISNIETNMSRLSNELLDTGDALEKVDESYEAERIADELVELEKIYSDDTQLNVEYNTRDMEKRNTVLILSLLNLIGKMTLGVTQSNHLFLK